MEHKITLPEIVLIADASYYNFIVNDVRKYYEKKLNRTLPVIDLTQFVTALALDAGIGKGNHETQLMWIYDEGETCLSCTQPADLPKELDGTAFRNMLGEFAFAGVPCSGMVSRENLFLDLLSIAADSAEVKKIIVIPHEEYGAKVTEALQKIEKKEIVEFAMAMRSNPKYDCKSLIFPLIHAFGIKGDEF